MPDPSGDDSSPEDPHFDVVRASENFFDDADLFEPASPAVGATPEPVDTTPEPVDTTHDPLPAPVEEPVSSPSDATTTPPLSVDAPTELFVPENANRAAVPHEEIVRRRSRIRRALVGGLVAWVAITAFVLAFGVWQLRNAQGNLDGAKQELTLANLQREETPGADATAASMRRAHSMFSSPILLPLKVVPVVGRQLRALDGMTDAVSVALEVGGDARRRIAPIAARPPTDGKSRLETLAEIERITADATERLTKIDLGPSNNLFGPLHNTRTRLASELNRIGELLQRGQSGAAGLQSFLEGPTRYAVFAANNAEMRAGSGMYLSAGTLEVENGELRLGPVRSITELPPAPNNVALEYDFLRLWGPQAPGSDYRFVNMTPRFPTSGALLQRMWAASGAPGIDGVLVMDPVGVVRLMEAQGKIEIDGRRLTPEAAVDLFLHDQYVQFAEKAERQDFLADAVQDLFASLNAGGTSPERLGASFTEAAEGRHLLAWSSDKRQQEGWSALGVDGVLPDQSVLFALQNRGGNKLDYFQRISAVASAKLTRTGTTMTMDYLITNAAREGDPAYVQGPTPKSVVQTPGTYLGIVSINVPAAAKNVRLSGGDYDLVSGPDGNTQVVSQLVQIDRGQSKRLRLQFDLPPGIRALTVLSSAREPSVFWHIGKLSWHDVKPRIIRW